MSYQNVLNALNTLKEYPELEDYIKNYSNDGGFMYGIETDTKKIQLKLQMENLLDDGNHSGASWGWLLRTIQGV